MGFRFRLEGVPEVQRKLREVRERLADLRPVLTVAAEDIKTLIDDSFRGQRSPMGKSWKALAPSTIARRRGPYAGASRRFAGPGGSNRITKLVDTGVLRNSISATAERARLKFGTVVPYGGTHQFGSRTVPARPYLPIEHQGGRLRWGRKGPAREELESLRAALRTYVLTGRVE